MRGLRARPVAMPGSKLFSRKAPVPTPDMSIPPPSSAGRIERCQSDSRKGKSALPLARVKTTVSVPSKSIWLICSTIARAPEVEPSPFVQSPSYAPEAAPVAPPAFVSQPAYAAPQAPPPQHPVAWHHHADRVASHGGPHGAHRGRAAQLLAERAVAGGVATPDGQQRAPHVLLKRRAARQVQRQLERGALATQVLVQLLDGGHQHRMVQVLRPGVGPVELRGLVALAVKPQADQALGRCCQPHSAQAGRGARLHGGGVVLHGQPILNEIDL